MKYLCLGYGDRRKMDARPKAEMDAIMRECRPFMEDLYNTGRVIIDAGLDWQTTSVRTVGGKVTVTDGPFVETKEQVGGVFLIEAEDLDEAIALASKHPAANMGEHFGWGIEIRPIHFFEQKPGSTS